MCERFSERLAAHCEAALKANRVTKSSEYYGEDLAACDQRAVSDAAATRGLAALFGPGMLGGCYLTLATRAGGMR